MDNPRTRQFWTLLLVFGAVVFGMVLAGGVEVTPRSESTPAPSPQPVAAEAGAPGGLPNFADLAERVSPAVVSIEATSFERASGGRGGRPDPFEFFFGPRRRDPSPQPDEEFRSDSGGSGFVISADGLIVTNNHVVERADELRVHLGDDTYAAEVKGTDAATDLALLQIKPDHELAHLALGDSEAVRVGEWVMAVGSPLGLTDTVTVGVVSAKERQIFISQDVSFENFIQTDAAINFGNSGGPLLNTRGEVIGINTAINVASENIGFAVPVNILKQILPQLRDTGRVRRGYLGIGVNEVDRRTAEAFGLDEVVGVLVTNVVEGLAADRAGIRHGDIIVGVDGREVRTTRGLIDYISSRDPDSEVSLDILREGERIEKKVQLVERPSGDVAPPPAEEEEGGSIDWLGVRYQELTPGLRSMHSLAEDVAGVWVTSISPRSPLYDEGVRTAGGVINVITEVNGQTVTGVEDFESAVRGAPSGSRLRMYVRRFARGEETQPLYVFPAVP